MPFSILGSTQLLNAANVIHQNKEMNVKAGDVVIVKGEECNRGHWWLGVVKSPIQGRDGVVRAAQL